MSLHKDQRVGVFVDVQNMYYSAKQLYHSKVNYTNILNSATAGRKLIRAITYVIKADVKDEKDFFDALEKIGFEVKQKDLQVFFGGAKKGDWDVGIAMDVMRLAAKLDVIVLVSGDGDFKDLLNHAKALGCRAEVIAFGKTASSRLKEEADHFIDMDKDKKFLIQKRRRRTKKSSNNKKSSSKNGSSNKKSSKKKSSGNKSSKRKSSSRKSSRRKSSKRRSRRNDDHVSMLQKLNMDQPNPEQKEDKKDKKKK
ncbi:NYN domain-containing protein [Candidatus Woesearchaeota archaeon]|nr:NYN domain-containing protein [Candidatus Woesearchaeota archaeon]